MDLREQLEYPAPAINRGQNKIYIETSKSCEGSLVIKNDGGGEIEGRIMSNSRVISFEPEYFSGNDSKIVFHVNLELLKPGDVFHTDAAIVTNGGEHTIEFEIKVIPYAIETGEGERISSLGDFYAYALANPIPARQMLISHEFLMWLYSTGYEYMDLYERFVKDSNKERALDNFLIINGFKSGPEIAVTEKNIAVNFRPSDMEKYRGSIVVNLEGWGYIEKSIKIKNNSPWLKIEKDKITSTDFAPKDYFNLVYTIDPTKLDQRVCWDKIIIGEKIVNVMAVRKFFIQARFEKEYMDFQENSSVIIHNHTGGKLTVDIHPKDNFIKFEGYRYIIGDYAKIPFHIKMSAVQKTQISVKRQSVIETGIVVQAVYNGIRFEKEYQLVIGNFI